MPFWEEIVECRPARGRAPWEPFEDGPAELVYWYRLDDPPIGDDGRLDPAAAIVLCDTMPGAVGQKVPTGDDAWFGPSADFTIHLFGSARPGWLLAHNRARHAGDGYASVEMALWDPGRPHAGRPRLAGHVLRLRSVTRPAQAGDTRRWRIEPMPSIQLSSTSPGARKRAGLCG